VQDTDRRRSELEDAGEGDLGGGRDAGTRR